MAASQSETLSIFTALRLFRPDWAGSLLLGIGLNDTGRALALASLAAGSASLFLEGDLATLRAAQREGCCTFAVTTLDEALRALKNEVRQGRAISVALGGDAARWLPEMVERGVLPQAIAAAREPVGSEGESLAVLHGWGAVRLAGFGFSGLRNSIDLQAMLDRESADRWRIVEDVAATLAERRAQDGELLAATGEEDAFSAATRVWLRAAPSLFPRALHRARWTPVSNGS